MTMTELDWIVDDYLRQLEAALGSLPASRRAQIVAEIAEHVRQARTGLVTQDEASIRALLARVGTPSEIAASALTEGVPMPHRRRHGRRRETLAVGIAILLVIVGVVVYFAQSGSSAITMPNVIGRSADAAESVLASSGIKHVSIVLEPSLQYPVGTVFGTNTKVGAVVQPDQQVNLQISTGPSVVPNLIGLTASEATRRLQALGLKWAIVRVHRDQSGLVVGQSPASGSRLEKQAWVEIDVTSTSTVVPRDAPYVLSMPARFAVTELRSLGFSVHVRYVTGGAPPGLVVAESPLNVPVASTGITIAVGARHV